MESKVENQECLLAVCVVAGMMSSNLSVLLFTVMYSWDSETYVAEICLKEPNKNAKVANL